MSKPIRREKALLDAAVTQHKSGNLPAAEILYRKLLRSNPKNVGGLNGLGLIAIKFNHLDLAHQFLSRSLQISPNLGRSHRYLGALYSARQDHERAIDCYEMALRLDPDDTHARQLIVQARKDFRISQDPDYALVTAAPWSSADWAWEEISGHSTIFVLFSGLGVGNKPPTFIFSKFLSRYPRIDKLFLRDLGGQWYLSGLGPISCNVEQTAQYIQEKTRDYKRTVFIGCSAGGMAAILYGELLRADKVLAFAPQTVLSEEKETEYNDNRWHESILQLREAVTESRHLDLKSMNPFSANIDIHYSAGCELDRLHAERLTGIQTRQIPHEGHDGHLIALNLRDTGVLRQLIENEFVIESRS